MKFWIFKSPFIHLFFISGMRFTRIHFATGLDWFIFNAFNRCYKNRLCHVSVVIKTLKPIRLGSKLNFIYRRSYCAIHDFHWLIQKHLYHLVFDLHYITVTKDGQKSVVFSKLVVDGSAKIKLNLPGNAPFSIQVICIKKLFRVI